MMLTDLADVLRAAGLQVVELAGWQTRGHAPMTDVRTIICHHTAGLDDRQVVLAGRPGLPGPLAHFWLSRTGVWHVIAAGLCYHAGVSRDPSYTNSHAIGIEAEALGTGVASDWPAAQMDAYVAGARALANHYGVPYSRVLGHKETCAPAGRKADPNFNMDAFRARIQEDDMPLNDADKAWLKAEIAAGAAAAATKVWSAVLSDNHTTPPTRASAAAWTVYGNIKAGTAANQAAAAKAAALGVQNAVTVAAADAVKRAITDGVLTVDVTVNGKVQP